MTCNLATDFGYSQKLLPDAKYRIANDAAAVTDAAPARNAVAASSVWTFKTRPDTDPPVLQSAGFSSHQKRKKMPDKKENGAKTIKNNEKSNKSINKRTKII